MDFDQESDSESNGLNSLDEDYSTPPRKRTKTIEIVSDSEEEEYTTPPKNKTKSIPAQKSQRRIQHYRKEWEKEKDFCGWLKSVDGNKKYNFTS